MNIRNKNRYQIIDTLRGVAIVLMFIYHFCYDLNHFQFIYADFRTSPFWINFRILIVSLFLGLVGVSLVIATHHGIQPRKYLKRLVMILCCSLIVTISSWFIYPDSFIYFGILHFIAIASVVGLLFTRCYWLNLVFGTGFILTAMLYSNALFNPKALNWIGLVSQKPVTEDYVPLFPWLGVVLIGMYLGKAVFVRNTPGSISASISGWHSTAAPIKLLSWFGKHGLLIYMIHQPIFFALLYPIYLLSR